MSKRKVLLQVMRVILGRVPIFDYADHMKLVGVLDRYIDMRENFSSEELNEALDVAKDIISYIEMKFPK